MIPEINLVDDWGIVEGTIDPEITTRAMNNSCKFLTNFEALTGPAKLFLPAGTYEFNMIFFIDKDDIEFCGETNENGEPISIIKFKAIIGSSSQKYCQGSDKNWAPYHCYLEILNTDNFNIHDLAFNGKYGGNNQGGVLVRSGATNGILKNLKIYDAAEVSLVIDGGSSTNPAHDIDVEDCTVYGQRIWDLETSKAMILAGGYSYNITFKNCKTYSVSPNNNNYYSPADHFDTDNATNVEYHNCVADGTGVVNNDDNRRGVGFWNEAYNDVEEDHETSSTYYNCTAIKTDGGLAATQNSDVVAHNFTFIECSYNGWAVWARGLGNFELYDSLFDGCYSIGPYGIKRGGFIIEGAPDGKFIKFKRNKFINTPPGLPHYDNINLYCPVDYTGDIEIFDNTFDANVTANTGSHAKNPVYVYWNIFEGSDSDLLKSEVDTDYIWYVLKAARTKAINSPTSNATVIISYGGESTNVNIPSGVSIEYMLNIIQSTIYSYYPAKINAIANLIESWLTFKQKSPNPDTTVNILINLSEWQNGSPFDDLNPVMTP